MPLTNPEGSGGAFVHEGTAWELSEQRVDGKAPKNLIVRPRSEQAPWKRPGISTWAEPRRAPFQTPPDVGAQKSLTARRLEPLIPSPGVRRYDALSENSRRNRLKDSGYSRTPRSSSSRAVVVRAIRRPLCAQPAFSELRLDLFFSRLEHPLPEGNERPKEGKDPEVFINADLGKKPISSEELPGHSRANSERLEVAE